MVCHIPELHALSKVPVDIDATNGLQVKLVEESLIQIKLIICTARAAISNNASQSLALVVNHNAFAAVSAAVVVGIGQGNSPIHVVDGPSAVADSVIGQVEGGRSLDCKGDVGKSDDGGERVEGRHCEVCCGWACLFVL